MSGWQRARAAARSPAWMCMACRQPRSLVCPFHPNVRETGRRRVSVFPLELCNTVRKANLHLILRKNRSFGETLETPLSSWCTHA